jgi:phosphopantothenate synthetase
MEKMK